MIFNRLFKISDPTRPLIPSRWLYPRRLRGHPQLVNGDDDSDFEHLYSVSSVQKLQNFKVKIVSLFKLFVYQELLPVVLDPYLKARAYTQAISGI